MGLRKKSGKLNLTHLDRLTLNYRKNFTSLSKRIEKGGAENIRKVNEKSQKDIAKASSPEEKKKIKNRAISDKKELQSDASKAQKNLTSMKDRISSLRNKGVGVIFTKSGNVRLRDLLTKQGRKTMLSEITIMTDSNVDKEYLKRKIAVNEKAEKAFTDKLNAKKASRRPTRTKRQRVVSGVSVNYFFDYEDDNPTDRMMDTITENIKRAIENTQWKHPNAPFNIRLSTDRGEDVIALRKGKGGKELYTNTRAFTLPTYNKWTMDEVLELILDKIDSVMETYDDGELEEKGYFEFETIVVSYLIRPDIITGAGGHKTIQQAHNSYFINDTSSKSNCFWRSISYIRYMRELNKKASDETEVDGIRDILLEPDQKIVLRKVNERAKTLKQSIPNTLKKTTTEDNIQQWVDIAGRKAMTRCEVKIYDNIFQLRKHIKPSYTPKNFKVIKTYEVQWINNHFIPLIRWYEIKNIKEICVEKRDNDKKEKEIQMEVEKDENILIDKKVKREVLDETDFNKWVDEKFPSDEVGNPLSEKAKNGKRGLYCHLFSADKDKVMRVNELKNNKIATYDIEATGNGNDENFKCYRISLAYNDLDELGSMKNIDGMKIKSFGGEDCISKFFTFIYENRSVFHEFTFYAHNAGKFDLLLLLNEYILSNVNKWKINTESLIVLNGAYINLELYSIGTNDKTSSEIKFRDSYRLLPMSLDKLGVDFNVPHKKQGKDLGIKFDEVNMDNCFGESATPIKRKELHFGYMGKFIRSNGKEEQIIRSESETYNTNGGEIDTNEVSILNTLDFKIELSQRVYCDYDTLCLLECLNQFNEDIYDAMNIDMTSCLTGASLSKQNFFKNYYSKTHTPIFTHSREFDAFCRKGYVGGRCEAHFIGEHKEKTFYYDFTSLYPDVGRKRLPYGKPFMVCQSTIDKFNDRVNKPLVIKKSKYGRGDFEEKLPTIVGMMKFKVKTIDFDALPIHGIKKDGKLIFPTFENWTEITLWSNEFNYAYSLGIYEYKLESAISYIYGGHGDYPNGRPIRRCENRNGSFWDEGILKNFFTEAVDKKALAKEQKKPALAQSYKIVANSGYGFWGLNANGDDGNGRDGMEIMENDDLTFWEMVDRNEVNNVGVNGEYTLVRTTKPMPSKDYNVSIAAAISSEARIKIHKFMNAIIKNGGKLLYCDTDSCITDIKLCDYPEMMKEFCWDGNGKELGSMKNEAEEKLEKYFKEKYGKKELPIHMEKQKEIDGGEYCFDKGIIAGCKQYCLHKKVYDGGVIEAEASKGCKRSLDYSDFHHLLYGSKMDEQRKYEEVIRKRKEDLGKEWEAPSGNRLWEYQQQFRSSLIEHIKEGTGTDIKIINLDKAMRINYTKGSVAGVIGCDGVKSSGVVKPLSI